MQPFPLNQNASNRMLSRLPIKPRQTNIPPSGSRMFQFHTLFQFQTMFPKAIATCVDRHHRNHQHCRRALGDCRCSCSAPFKTRSLSISSWSRLFANQLSPKSPSKRRAFYWRWLRHHFVPVASVSSCTLSMSSPICWQQTQHLTFFLSSLLFFSIFFPLLPLTSTFNLIFLHVIVSILICLYSLSLSLSSCIFLYSLFYSECARSYCEVWMQNNRFSLWVRSWFWS